MKILVVAHNLQTLGGIQTSTRNLCKTLRELGEKVQTVELARPTFFLKVVFVLRFCGKALFWRPDFIFITNLNYSPLGLFAKIFLNLSYSITFHGIEAQDIKKPIHRLAIKRAKNLVKVFEETGRKVLKQFPEAKEKFVTIPNTMDTVRFHIKPKRKDLVKNLGLHDSKIILTICRMSTLDGDNKGYRRIIKALPNVLERVPDAKYVLAGTGDDAENTRKLSEELGLKDKVILPGAIDAEDMTDFYNLADVFALPSKNEGFPALVLLESLACGVPVLGGAQPDARELFHGKYGLIVEPDNVEEIGEGLVKILTGDVPADLKDRNWLRDKALEEYGQVAYKNAVRKAVDVFRK